MKAKKTTMKIVKRIGGKSGLKKTAAAPDCGGNMEKLIKSGILEIFVIENKASWDHQEWLRLCEEISNSEFYPVDFDQVGLLLENKKTAYLEPRNAVIA
ncbi:MAG TPA: hypothetical protein DET40_01575 [Lentisphaeria bacterium]|nr:MAG: hypothetical protein A2X45_17145 [Lentisphaerae bacterium GWF2_50_93]HCE42223.1 hypothetical protein [Lentisphaeria bacterium]